MKLGEIIIEYRNTHEMSMREFAKKCNLSNSYVSMLERGFDGRGKPIVPSIETINRVAVGCDSSFNEIFNKLDCDYKVGVNSQYSSQEQFFLEAYRNTDDETKAMINRLLKYSEMIGDKK